jgi:cytochrome c553
MFNRRFAIVFAVSAVLAVSAIVVSSMSRLALVAAPARADDAPSADAIATKALACAICHGQNGMPIAATFPIIWGQQSNYLYKELHDFHSGDRNNPVMAPLVQSTSLDDLRALSNYFAAKSWPAKPADGAASPTVPPEAIAAKIEMCKACHQANFEGGAPAPRLAGLSYQYLRSAMNAFANGQRTNNLDMPGFMKALTESERDAMAKYLAGL